ncbi:MAG TPA: NnrS family protein [Acetobacteraceae bacterium]|nr:NnrS family protein [Acetobacteraceae bacterium]
MHRMPPLLTAGFRPFFLAAAAWAVLAMAAWLPQLSGELELPSRFDPLNWHVHEMLFGFVMAAVGGFLLTAIPNWTGRAPVAGTPLAVLVALWLLGRVVCLFSALIPGWLAPVADLAFPVALEVVAARELFSAGNKRNYPLLAPVLVLAIANLLMHLQALGAAVPIGLGWRLAIATVSLLISVIGGRIVPAFTNNWLNARGIAPVPPPICWLEGAARGTLIAAILGWVFLPDWRSPGVLLLAAAALNLARLARWRGVATLEEPLLLILHVGYLWLVLGVALLGLSLISDAVPPAAAAHALTAGAMGTMSLAVMTRATLGHTGRVLRADKVTVLIYALASASAVLRIVAAWMIDGQMDLYEVAALAWVGAFTLFAAEYGPMLLAPRL